MRFPVAPELISRDGVSNKNARMTNVVKDGAKASVRPGLAVNAEYEGIGAGLISFGQSVFPIYGGTLFTPDGTIDIATGGPAVPPAWDASYTYPAGFLVTYGGGTWRAVTPVVGAFPTAGDWTVVVAGSDDANQTLVAGTSNPSEDINFYGFIAASIGSLTSGEYASYPIFQLVSTSQYNTPSPGDWYYTTGVGVTGLAAQGLFTSVTVNGSTLLSSSASWAQDEEENATTWLWAGEFAIPAIGTYPVVFA